MSDPSMRYTQVFECGAVHFSIDGRGVGHANFGQGSSIVSREVLVKMLQDIARDAVAAQNTVQQWEAENPKPHDPDELDKHLAGES